MDVGNEAGACDADCAIDVNGIKAKEMHARDSAKAAAASRLPCMNRSRLLSPKDRDEDLRRNLLILAAFQVSDTGFLPHNVRAKRATKAGRQARAWQKCTAYRQPGPGGLPLALGLGEGLGVAFTTSER